MDRQGESVLSSGQAVERVWRVYITSTSNVNVQVIAGLYNNTPWIIIFQGRDGNISGGGESVEADCVTNLGRF